MTPTPPTAQTLRQWWNQTNCSWGFVDFSESEDEAADKIDALLEQIGAVMCTLGGHRWELDHCCALDHCYCMDCHKVVSSAEEAKEVAAKFPRARRWCGNPERRNKFFDGVTDA